VAIQQHAISLILKECDKSGRGSSGRLGSISAQPHFAISEIHASGFEGHTQVAEGSGLKPALASLQREIALIET
jgi:hypothetical protein